MQDDIKVNGSKFCKHRSYMCVPRLLPMLESFWSDIWSVSYIELRIWKHSLLIKRYSSHFIFFCLSCNPCMLINITSLQTIRTNTFFSVNGSNYFQKTKRWESRREALNGKMLPSKNREKCNICLIVTFATFAILAFCFVTSWFVSFLNLLLLGYFVFLLVRT